MPIGKTKARLMRSELESAQRAASMELAAFDKLSSTKEIRISEREVTNFIRKRTELFRKTWIISPVERVIEILNEEIEGT
tara:strand:+ start:333 stop:572 length:240 start_codon:yes stop_codon:yes gene_type:complete